LYSFQLISRLSRAYRATAFSFRIAPARAGRAE